MDNPVMNYKQFMDFFKKASEKYRKKGNIEQKDVINVSKIDQKLSTLNKKGKTDTETLQKYNKKHLNSIKK